jgi:hypothetical protein
MLFRSHVLRGIAEGRVTLAFRRWRRPPPAAGSTLRSPVGVLSIDHVAVVEAGDITAEDICRTGMSRDELQASLDGDGRLLRIEFRVTGADPRLALREELPGPAAIEAVAARLSRIDAGSGKPWTLNFLRLIAERPATVSHVLAKAVGMEVLAFKIRVRRLKELGLTKSLAVGYRLSPRGRAVLEHLQVKPR